MAREQNRAIALLGALIVVCQPCSAFVSVVGPAAVVRSSYGAGLRPSTASVPSNEHARAPVSLAGQRSRAGSALSMGAKSVGVPIWMSCISVFNVKSERGVGRLTACVNVSVGSIIRSRM